MKKTILLICLCLSTLTTWAQNANIHFNIQKCETKNLSNNVVEALDLKLHQILNRNSAAAADKYNAFVVVPQLALTNMLSTEGGVVRNVSLAQGELVLIAKNRVDSAEYYAVTIPLEGDAVGSKEKALLNMVKRIKVNNPAFTRFVRTSRKKIEEYYTENCATILQKGLALYNEGRFEESLQYLSVITPHMPCFEQADTLKTEIMKNITKE